VIARLKGLVDAVGTDTAVIDVNGVGYLVHASSRTLSQMGQGDAVALFIETHVREDHIHLYGFLRADEQDWFRLLTTVQGVGAKVALAMLSALTGDMLLQAIAAGDKAAVCRAPGVGPKLAQRILHELKDKVGADSYRHREAGAHEVALVSGTRYAIMHELRGAAEPSFEDILGRLGPCDLVLIEGYKREPVPKIEARRLEARSREPLAPNDPHIVAIAADHPVEDSPLPVFDLDDTMAIADFIADIVKLPVRTG